MEHISEVRELLENRFGLLALEDSLIFILFLEGYRYIVRDPNGYLWAHKGNVKKGRLCWYNQDEKLYRNISFVGTYLFENIKWEDEEPFSIDTYLGENLLCEDNIE